MKRFVYPGILSLVLISILIGPSVFVQGANDPFSYLTPEEQSYVGAMRSSIVTVHSWIQVMQGDCDAFVWPVTEAWWTRINTDNQSLNIWVRQMQGLKTPPDFSGISEKSRTINGPNLGGIYVQLMQGAVDFVAREVTAVKTQLLAMDNQLYDLSSSVDSTIQKVANSRQGGGGSNDLVDLISCLRQAS